MEPNIKLEIKAVKKYKKINGKYVEDTWTPDPKWINHYKKINYKGNPLNKKIQKKIHKIYNSLSNELKQDWLKKTSGLGWSDEYIQIALTYWDKQGEYHETDKECVAEYMMTLTSEEKDNFKDICEVFCPENPHVHIKNSCGYIEYNENKQTIKDYIKNASNNEKDIITDLVHDMEWGEEYHFMMTYIKIQELLKKYDNDDNNDNNNDDNDNNNDNNDDNLEYKYLKKKIKKMEWKDKLKFLKNYDKAIQFWKDTKVDIDKHKINHLTMEEYEEINEYLDELNFTQSWEFLEKLSKISSYMSSLNSKDLNQLKNMIKDIEIEERYISIMDSDGFKEFLKN